MFYGRTFFQRKSYPPRGIVWDFETAMSNLLFMWVNMSFSICHHNDMFNTFCIFRWLTSRSRFCKSLWIAGTNLIVSCSSQSFIQSSVSFQCGTSYRLINLSTVNQSCGHYYVPGNLSSQCFNCSIFKYKSCHRINLVIR